jgi:hypothetical protein
VREETREVKDDPKKLREFFDEFIETHRIRNGDRFELVVTDEDCMRLGEFFIRGMVGWASGYDLAHKLHSSPSHSRLAGIVVEEVEGEEEPEADEDESEEKSFIH